MTARLAQKEEELVHVLERWKNYPQLIGETFTKVKHDKTMETLQFLGGKFGSYEFYHMQDCCEGVWIEDICGDLSDLEGSPITMAEEFSCEADGSYKGEDEDRYFESGTWTFYKFATAKGSVTVRWVGESNGYYSESVDFREMK
ncbi:hypothetical protein [Zhongshania sp.]|uniref:DUF7448 domain-containing protein n=1 Tax=Zhongshania sp. TaxID=1971902 RepID=UPI003563902C